MKHPLYLTEVDFGNLCHALMYWAKEKFPDYTKEDAKDYYQLLFLDITERNRKYNKQFLDLIGKEMYSDPIAGKTDNGTEFELNSFDLSLCDIAYMTAPIEFYINHIHWEIDHVMDEEYRYECSKSLQCLNFILDQIEFISKNYNTQDIGEWESQIRKFLENYEYKNDYEPLSYLQSEIFYMETHYLDEPYYITEMREMIADHFKDGNLFPVAGKL